MEANAHREAQEYQDHFEYRIVKAIAQAYVAEHKDVTSIGEVDDEASWLVVCKECRLRELQAPRFMEETVGLGPPTQVNFVVRLLPKLRIFNNAHIPSHRCYVVLAEQCEDCGHIYCAWSPLKPGIRRF